MGSGPAKESDSLLKDDEAGGSALEAGGAFDIYSRSGMGYLCQYFAVGAVYGGLPGTMYGLFICYLNVPAYVSSTASTLATVPWTLKILFALLTDTTPLFGYRRRPYMAIGWSVCAAFLFALYLTPLPAPYYCVGTDGAYDPTRVCNPAAATAGAPFAFLMMGAAFGYVMADVAADALTMTYARREPKAQRGRTQTTAYLARECGQIAAQLLVGFGMNGKEYNGTFEHGLSFNAVCALLALPALAMVPISWYFVEEPRVGGGCCAPRADGGAKKTDAKGGEGAGVAAGDEQEEAPLSRRAYFASAFGVLRSGAMLEVIAYLFLSGMVGGIGTTAGAEIQRVWADVQNLQSQLFAIGGHLLFVLGLWLVRERFLHTSWRRMIIVTSVFINLVDMPFTFLTVFGTVRNQYFYLDDALITALPGAANFIVSTYVMVEMAEKGTEGLTYGLLTTAANLGGPAAVAISNTVFGAVRPSLSDAANYVADTFAFRSTVAWSCVATYAFSFGSLLLLPLLPDQKADTHARKASRPRRDGFAYLSIGVLTTALLYSITMDAITVIPATSCLQIAGGPGCETAAAIGGGAALAHAAQSLVPAAMLAP